MAEDDLVLLDDFLSAGEALRTHFGLFFAQHIAARYASSAVSCEPLTRYLESGTMLYAPGRQTIVVGEDATHWYDISLNYGSNARLMLTPKSWPKGWDWGWCFRSAEVVIAAVAAWNPQTQDEPAGWHKRPTYNKVRRAPLRDQETDYNRPRCVHGTYTHVQTCIDPDCA